MPPARPQSALRSPLNAILGTEANVRVLRVLSRGDTSLAAGELAQRAGLSRTRVYPVLDALEEMGIVEYHGAGAGRQVTYRKTHPLAGAIANLFDIELERVNELIAELRRVLASLQPPPTAAWLEGKFLSGKDLLHDAITCVIVSDPGALSMATDTLSRQLEKIERRFGVHIELRGSTRSEVAMRAPSELRALEDVILLSGVPPTTFVLRSRSLSNRQSKSHDEHDAAARRLAAAIVEKIKRDPGLIRVAQRHLKRREKSASPQERRELQEWARILGSMPPSRLRRFLVDQGEQATRLRQTFPTLELLTSGERRSVLASGTEEEARAVVTGRRRSVKE